MVGEERNYGTVTNATGRSATCIDMTSTEDEVIIETSDGSLFLLSRWRLAAESLFFRALFHGNYLESKSSRVRLSCICSSDFRACLSLTAHIYRGTTPKISAKTAMKLLATASFLQMSTLMEELNNTVVNYLHPSDRLAAYREATVRSGVLANKLWSSIIKEFRLHLYNRDYEKMTESEILNALIDERLDIESEEEEPLINKWIAKNPRNHNRMLRLKSEALRRGGTDGRLNAVVRDRVPRELLLAIGGWNIDDTLDIVEVFNPRANMWVIPNAAVRETPRAYHGAALCGRKIVVLGGSDGTESIQHAKLFDLDTKSWGSITNMHDRRCFVAATPFIDPSGIQYVVATGGFNDLWRLNSAEIFDFERDHWYHLPLLSKKRSDASAVMVAGRPMVIGGDNGWHIYRDVEVLDFQTQSWLRGSSKMRTERTGMSAVTYEENTVIVVGGFNGIQRLKSTELYDHRVGHWYPLPDMETTRSNCGIELMNESIYIAGGFDGTQTTSAVERFDIRAYKWERVPSMSGPRSALRLVRIADHDIIRSLVNFTSQPFDFNFD